MQTGNPASETPLDVSVIIPAYHHCPYLPQVIAALLQQSFAPRKIIVSHSGPHDPPEARAQEHGLRPAQASRP